MLGFLIMIELEYKQQCDRPERHEKGRRKRRHSFNGYYFYIRSHDRSPREFQGIWELPENHLFTVHSAEYLYNHLSGRAWREKTYQPYVRSDNLSVCNEFCVAPTRPLVIRGLPPIVSDAFLVRQSKHQ